ncbi:hypothetical protein KORDIASMS9_03996 [Kordia sp. SMS9]|uniref:tetratricopeptide repeat protein n=1 Tax=Kordia sp. SMS9 TaxID=2282170 RepID=UPI000E100D43|nr:hypothetical protein [Kordia sp. SMS9]AXG71739.1 hypothetical protein KORDIASMS9_03996 [Kordia sp. SMS9]
MKFNFFCLLFLYFSSVFSQETDEVYAKNVDANDEKVIELGQNLTDSFYEEDSSFFMDNFNVESFAKKVISVNKDISENAVMREFNRTFRDGIFFDKFHKFPDRIRAMIEDGASYSIVNYYYHLDERKYHLLFRMYAENIGLNYHDYQLSFEDGTFQLQDIFIYSTGQYLSETYQDLYQLSIPGENIEVNRERLKSMIFFGQYKTLARQKKYKQIFDLMRNLTGEFTTKKIYFLTKIKIAAKMNQVFHLEAIDELLRNFPNDPTTKLMAINYHLMLKDYNTTMQLLDEIQAITEDVFIEYIRGNAAWQFEDFESAEKAYAYTIREYPDFEKAKLNLMYLYDFLEKHEDNIVLLNNMIENDEYNKKDLIDFIDDTSNEFIHLPNARIYNRWKKKK